MALLFKRRVAGSGVREGILVQDCFQMKELKRSARWAGKILLKKKVEEEYEKKKKEMMKSRRRKKRRRILEGKKRVVLLTDWMTRKIVRNPEGVFFVPRERPRCKSVSSTTLTLLRPLQYKYKINGNRQNRGWQRSPTPKSNITWFEVNSPKREEHNENESHTR